MLSIRGGGGQKGPKFGQDGYITPTFLGFLVLSTRRKSEVATSHLPSQGPKSVQDGYTTLPSWG